MQEDHRIKLIECVGKTEFPKLTSLSLLDDNYASIVKAFIIHVPLQFLKLVNCILDDGDMEGIVVGMQKTLEYLWMENIPITRYVEENEFVSIVKQSKVKCIKLISITFILF